MIVLDEPSSNLDIKTIDELKKIISVWKEEGASIIVAEHRLYYLMDLADRVAYMKDGEIKEIFRADEFWKLNDTKLHQRGLRSSMPVDFHGVEPASFDDQVSIRFSGLSLQYNKKEMLNIPRLSIPKGAVVGILGLNGAGKSTLARCLCGLEKSVKGKIEIHGSVCKQSKLHEKCYMVMQDVNHQLFTESVLDEVLLSIGNQRDEDRKTAGEILTSLDLLEYEEMHPMSLSGGQKQRVAIATAMAANREVIVFDEPTSGLDYNHMLEVSGNIKALRDLEKTVLIITHDPELIRETCNYFIFLEAGKVVWSGGLSEDSKNRLSDFFTYIS